MEEKLKRLEEELAKYEVKLKQMLVDWSVGRGGSRYGDEYLEVQTKVYQAMIDTTKEEIVKLKKSRLKSKI